MATTLHRLFRIGFVSALLLGVTACGDPSEAGDSVKQDTREFRARLELKKLVSDLKMHHARHGEWPMEWEDMRANPPLDPWGAVYEFEIEDDEVVVYSLGRDGKPGTGDEIR